MKYLCELIIKKDFSAAEDYSEISKSKLLLPYKYAELFCDFISSSGKYDFEEKFEDDLEFQEIIYQSFYDIDDDEFEDLIEYLKKNYKTDKKTLKYIFDYFLSEAEILYVDSEGDELKNVYKNAILKSEKWVLKSLEDEKVFSEFSLSVI